ncbi:MAG: undecaprenyldiphospho-muramoylpentapeptide beta-N-acetylglucosaminyltransferase [Candidatus Arsenophonus melophagi]|nr:undecaprenyldiphospho-muramoylpentapeptide beta-N-acetylglucosaminyltransferase [Candidatus Arsenophonus melophagi]
MNQQKRLIIMAGGTGGHVFPGLAIADYLKQKDWDVRWLGTADRIEAHLVPQNGIEIDFINISPLRGKGIKAWGLTPFKIIRAIKQARIIIQRYQPDVVLGMGGYVSGPGGIAAWLCNVPIVVHEQNGVAGLTNRWLAKIATCVLQAFPSAFPDALVVGNPVRKTVLALLEPEKRLIDRDGTIRILVIGGSQGASILNQTLPEVAAQLDGKVNIFHQTGKGAQKITEMLYKTLCVKSDHYKVTEFISDMAAAYAWADLIICRAGALTVSEIAVAGLPAIFVPFRHKDRQQYFNALPLEKAGAAKIIEQSQCSADVLVTLLRQWSRKKLLDMAKKARMISITDATKRIASTLIEVAKCN